MVGVSNFFPIKIQTGLGGEGRGKRGVRSYNTLPSISVLITSLVENNKSAITFYTGLHNKCDSAIEKLSFGRHTVSNSERKGCLVSNKGWERNLTPLLNTLDGRTITISSKWQKLVPQQHLVATLDNETYFLLSNFIFISEPH